METRKLYYEDPHLDRFTGTVVLCNPTEGGWEVVTDATAFYPEGGGQAWDTGSLGGRRVLAVREAGGAVIHLCDGPLEPGQEAEGVIDYGPRFHRMQQHSGEHIVSGILHRRYGAHNTGFHMGAQCTTIDFDTAIPLSDLKEVEAEANRAVWLDLPVRCWYPEPEDLRTIAYRSKKALDWPVRLVQVPGFDCCACCGTHVVRTGEIGPVKLLSAVSFRGGTRLEMACGARAMEILNGAYDQNRLVSKTFSAPPEATGAAAERMKELLAQKDYRIGELERRVRAGIAGLYRGAGDVVHFEPGLDSGQLRELADAIAQCCGGIACCFTGSDEGGYAYCLVARDADLRLLGKAMNAALNGRGGGKSAIQQGRVNASEEKIRSFFAGR